MNYTGRRALSGDECELIRDGFCGRHAARDRALFELGRLTGFRISELLSLKIEDVFDGTRVREIVRVARTKTGAGRSMPINPRAADAIKLYLLTSRRTHTLFAKAALFPAQGGTRAMCRRQAWVILRQAAARAGVSLERLGTHSLRKTFASAAYSAVGKDLARLARLLGHQNPANTLRYVEGLDDLTEIVTSMR